MKNFSSLTESLPEASFGVYDSKLAFFIPIA
jgi:hypothetical protein